MSKIDWNTYQLCFEHEGNKVFAEVRWWSKEVCVDMLEPFQGLHSVQHIFYACPHIYDAERADKVARHELVRLFKFGSLVLQNRDKIEDLYTDYGYEETALKIIEAELTYRKVRRIHRTRLRNQEITNSEYQNILRYARLGIYVSRDHQRDETQMLKSEIEQILDMSLRNDELQMTRRLLNAWK